MASNFLASLKTGDRLSLKIISGSKHFKLPQDSSIPLILACTGSGIAPFRGFIQERALQQNSGQDIAPILLFFGVEKLDGDTRFVQHRIWAERASVAAQIEKGAQVFTCDDGEYMEPAVRNTLVDIYQDSAGASVQAAQDWFALLEDQHRYIADVFS